MNNINYISKYNNNNNLNKNLGFYLEEEEGVLSRINKNHTLRQKFVEESISLEIKAFREDNITSLSELHTILFNIYAKKFSKINITCVNKDFKPVTEDISCIFEEAIIRKELSCFNIEDYKHIYEDPKSFTKSLSSLIKNHPAYEHELYSDFILNKASVDDIKYFLAQETSLDPRFDDMLAFLQIGLNGISKMEIASNYWDEMGNGVSSDVHTKLFEKALTCLNISKEFIDKSLLLESMISSNLSSYLSLERKNYFKAIGYFWITETMAPKRFDCLIKGWKRLNLPAEGIEYHILHKKIDLIHGDDWLKKVIGPESLKDENIRKEIIRGSLIRLNSSNNYLDAILTKIKDSNNVLLYPIP